MMLRRADPPPPEPEHRRVDAMPDWCVCGEAWAEHDEPGEDIMPGDEHYHRKPPDPPVVPAPPVCHAAHADDALMHLRCRLSKGHQGDHRDGSCSWAAASPTVLVELSDEELGRIAFEAFFADPYATSWPRAARAVRDALAEKEADR